MQYITQANTAHNCHTQSRSVWASAVMVHLHHCDSRITHCCQPTTAEVPAVRHVVCLNRLPDGAASYMWECTSCNAHYMCRAQVRLQAVPEQGCILVSHPLLRDAYSSFFHQTVVLVCRHSFASGTYGLFLNRFLSADAKAKVDRMMRGRGSQQSQQAAGSSSGLDLARDMPAALQAMLG